MPFVAGTSYRPFVAGARHWVVALLCCLCLSGGLSHLDTMLFVLLGLGAVLLLFCVYRNLSYVQ